MKRTVRALVAGVAALALSGASVSLSSFAYADAGAPSITTDQADYAPGSLVDLTGADWPAGDKVHITVDDSDGQTWRYSADAVADDFGAFEIQFNLPDWFVANYTAVAMDADGLTATRAFTDGNVQGKVFAGTTQVAKTLAVTKYFGSGTCAGRFKTNQVTTSATGNTNLAGVGGGASNPQSIGVIPPNQIVVGTHLYTFDHWTVAVGRAAAVTIAGNPCLTDTSDVAAYYTDSGVTTQQQQTITFDPIPDKTYGAADFGISPTSDSGLTVSVSATGPCTLSSATSPATVHITGTGTCAITASQAGNASYLAATPVEQDFLVSPSSTGVTVNVTCPSTGQVFTGSAIEPCTAEAIVDGVSHAVSSLTYADNVHVGQATATASYSDANHSLTTNHANFDIVPASVTVTVTGGQTYGGSPSFTPSYTLPGGVGISGDVTCSKILNGTTISPTLTAGGYTLLSSSCSGLQLDNSDYAISYVGSTFTVAQAVITATVTGGHVYGGTPAFSQTNNASGVSVSGTPSCTSTTSPVHTIDSALAAGTYSIDGSTCSGLTPSDATNYRIVYSGGNYVVTRAQIAVAVSGGQTYGGTSKSFTGTPPSPMPTGVTYVQGSLACTKLASNVSIANSLGVNSYTIDPTTCTGDSLSGTEADNFTIAHSGGAFVVSPLSITVAVSGTQTYGSGPTFTPDYSSTGFVNGDTSSVVSGTLACLPSSTTLTAGSHAITSCSGLSATNYTIGYSLGSLVVSQKSITASASGTQVYGDAPHWSVTYPAGSFVSPDTSSVVTGTLACTPVDATLAVSATGYDITGCSGLSATNYSIGYTLGKLVVTQRSITVNVTGSRVYGNAASYTPGFSGADFVNGDTSSVVTGTLICSTNSTGASPVGSSYTVSDCSGLSATNYAISYTYGALTVTQRPVNVAVTGTQVYGGTGVTYTPSYTGTDFVNGDTSSVVTNNLTGCTSDASATSPVGGTYHVLGTCSGLTATNYAITIVPGSFTVTPKSITATITGTQVYGDAPSFFSSFNAADFVSPDTDSVVSGPLSGCHTSATASSPVGSSYTTSGCSGLSASNYTIAYSYGALSVTQRPVNVTVNGTQVYGGTGVAYTPSYTGTDFVNGDTSSVITNNLTGCSSDASTSSPVAGTYHVLGTCSGLSATNYAITIVPGAFTVTPALLTVTAADKNITYGDALPAYTYGVTGYVLGQNSSVITTAPSCNAVGVPADRLPGSYPIHCSGAAAANYLFAYVDGTLTIGRKAATLGYTGNLFWSTGSATATTANVTLQATLTPGSGGTPDLTKGAPVTFRLYKSSNLTMTTPDATCTTTTMSSTGVATCSKTLDVDNWTVIASIGTNSFFDAADSDPVVLTVYQPSTDKHATGGGWVNDADTHVSSANRHGNFGFTVRFSKNGAPTGQAVFVFRGSDGYDYVVKSNSWNGGGLSFGTNSVSFSAKANVTAINPVTGQAVAGLGGGNYTFRVDATDNGTGTNSPSDTYGISVYAPSGALFHQTGASAGAQTALGGGNITVHSTATK